MKTSTIVAIGGGVFAALGLALGLRKAGQVESGVLAATGGDASKAAEAGMAAKSAKTSGEVKAAAAKAEEAANYVPPTSGDVKAEVDAAKKAADEATTPAEIVAAGKAVAAAAEKMTGNITIQINATNYYPVSESASEKEKKMEGGSNGAASWNGNRVVDPATGKRIVLHSIEEYLAGKVPYFSISGDPVAWPWGQAILVDWFDGKKILGRVVDMGSHFTGSLKVYRAMGREPLDLRTDKKSTKVLEKTTATIVRGDNFDKTGRDLVASAFRGQESVVVGALHMLGAC